MRPTLITCLLLLVQPLGCTADGGGKGAAYDERRFVRAEIVRPAMEGKQITTVAGDELTRLTQFLPHAGEGRRSLAAGAWKGGPIVRLSRGDGTVVRVWVNPSYASWADETGEWPLHRGFEAFLDSLAWQARPTTRAVEGAG